MNYHPPPDATNAYLADYVFLVTNSLRKLKGVSLVDASLDKQEQAKQVFAAPYVLLTHNATDDPVFQYANKTGLTLFELSWQELVTLHSKYSAELQNRAAREKLLNEVSEKGYADNYSGVRISKTGKRFEIKSATVWNILDDNNNKCGQAAMFTEYTFL